MGRTLAAVVILIAMTEVAHAQKYEPSTGYQYVIPVAPGGGTNPPPVTADPPIVTYAAPSSGTVGTTSTVILSSPGSLSNIICNVSGGATMTINLNGGTAVAGIGVPVLVGQCLFLGGLTNSVSAIATASETYSVEVGN